MYRLKLIKRQDSCWKQAKGCSGETSLNLSRDIFEFLTNNMVDFGEQCGITFTIYREDFNDAISFIKSQLPLYVSTSKSSEIVNFDDDVINKLQQNVMKFFGSNEELEYTVNLYCRKDGRIYLNGLRQNGFSVRDYLVENGTTLKFCMDDKGYSLRVLSSYFIE
jgi:hypothetical protein